MSSLKIRFCGVYFSFSNHKYKNVQAAVLAVFGGVVLAAALPVLGLPETRGKPLLQTVCQVCDEMWGKTIGDICCHGPVGGWGGRLAGSQDQLLLQEGEDGVDLEVALHWDLMEKRQCLNKIMENSLGGDNYKARGCSSLKSDGKDNAVPYLDKFLLAMSPSCPSQEGHIQVGLALICLRLRLSELDRSGTKYLLSNNFSSRQFPCHSLRHVWYRKSFYLKFQP